MKVVIIIPTYNESENIASLIFALQIQFRYLSHPISILIVDDNSPDSTAEIIKRIQSRFNNIFLISGTHKAGLGNAYIRGMIHAVYCLEADVIFEMDADLSHKPSDIPRMLERIESGADFVIGSRYIRGGKIPNEWNIFRRLNSIIGNFAARHIAGIPSVRDCTAGFRAIRSSIIKRIDIRNIRVQGYVFQVSLLYRAIQEGARVEEIPVEFIDRKFGKSKLGIFDVVEFIFNVWRIRHKLY